MGQVKSEKDMGVITSNDLKVSEQCQQACKIANMMLGLMKRTITGRNPMILISLYKSLVRPHLEYSLVLPGHHTVMKIEN
jgi:ribonucleases P/MRP protein subunit RPP40